MNSKRVSDKKPDWLKIKLPSTKEYAPIKEIVKRNKLHTICESGNCPNRAECWGSGTATFMILGNICTRSCKFCAVETGKPKPIDETEAEKIAQSVKTMNLKHCVITSVDRDDLSDGGASAWVNTIKEIRRKNPNTTIETLIPDFKAKIESLKKIIDIKPEVVSHNLETVERLNKLVRNQANYERSLSVLKTLKEAGILTKSGIMLGLGETQSEILKTMDNLLEVGCQIFTLGQYLQPTRKHLAVEEYVTPQKFDEYKNIGLKKGFKIVESGPLVRSSYHAESHLF
ncbi:MAG: lipoyl synthase [Bacteroidetes bacterium]|jgi:lipoyl synthase|nr:lipoyl synthase [Bacteroidota bacterium]MBT6687927.1 lipoyl synthase [Bacteroidota bacterium]MBT7143266.1 lipoyl synthase [Bacteroidota bacterium]MBT7490247.1 lipoyl synthase [Bacteroidota bacterium]